ncbi:hypothetical protein MMC16_000096 [Acarospora aff. strigata]|nr:hypothetical protein [Acarospora aff. strigata]
MFALSSVALFTHALPLSSPPVGEQRNPQSKAARYSVVPVDGGSSNAPMTKTEVRTVTQTSDTTKTVTEPPTTLPATTETVISTVFIHEPDVARATTTSPAMETGTAASQVLPTSEAVQPGSSSSSISCTTTASASSSTSETAPSTTLLQVSSSVVESLLQTTVSPTSADSLNPPSHPSQNASSSTFVTSSSVLGAPFPTLPSHTEDDPVSDTPAQRLSSSPTFLWSMSPATSPPSMPKLSPTTIESTLATEVPSVVVTKQHKAPEPDRTLASPTGSFGTWNSSGVALHRRGSPADARSEFKRPLIQ